MSFGHAAYLGIGGYAVGMLAHRGRLSAASCNGRWRLPPSALFALVIGALVAAHARRLFHHDHAWPSRRWPITSSPGWRATAATTASPSTSAASSLRRSICRTRCSSITSASLLLFAAIYLVWRLVNSRFGMVVQGARSNDMRMRAIGFPTYRYKLVCFVIAGTLCGLAGALLANHTDFVSPAMMYWTRSGDLIIMVVLGGMGSPFGPVFGAVALLVLEEVLSGITEYWQIILGPLLLLVVLFARGGIDGLLQAIGAGRGHERAAAARPRTSPSASAASSPPTTSTLGVAPGELHAVIGPNGAGKTTLIAQLSGQLRPDSGRIHFAGHDITALPMHQRSALGLARSFQITSLFLDLTVLDNVALAVQAHAGHSFRFWRDARRETELREPARAALARVGLGAREDRPAAALEPRRAPAARAGDGARRQSAHAAAGRADGRTGAGRIRAHGRIAAGAQEGADHPSGRARHGGGVRARRPHHGAGLWPRASHRARPPPSAPTRTCATPISASRRRPMPEAVLEVDRVETATA